jgi:sugar diacid utilization regulator
MRELPVPDEVLREVAAAGADDAGGVDPELLGDFLPGLVSAVASGRRPSKASLQRCQARGREAARRGVALRALLDLYLSASWRLWRHLPVVASPTDGAAVAAAGEVALRAVDDAVAALSEGYQLARRSLVREQESARREFVDDLLSGRADVGGLVDRAAGFGLDLSGPHAVAIVRTELPVTDAAPLLAVVERAVQGSKGDAEVLVASKEGRLVVVFAAPDRPGVAHVVDRIGTALRPTGDRVHLHRRTDVGEWQLGVGRPRSGSAGVLASYDEARDALDLAARVGLEVPVVQAEDLLAYQVLLRDRAAIVDLITTLLDPLRQARGGAEPLLQTLEAYFDAGANSAQAARALHLSVRAVTYRLERVRALTGVNPSAPRDAFALHSAVLGARLLGWPTVDL